MRAMYVIPDITADVRCLFSRPGSFSHSNLQRLDVLRSSSAHLYATVSVFCHFASSNLLLGFDRKFSVLRPQQR